MYFIVGVSHACIVGTGHMCIVAIKYAKSKGVVPC